MRGWFFPQSPILNPESPIPNLQFQIPNCSFHPQLYILSVSSLMVKMLPIIKKIYRHLFRHYKSWRTSKSLYWFKSYGNFSEWVDFAYWGDSMSKVREKRSTSKSGFFFNEMWKIIGQIDDFDRFLSNSCNLGGFLAKNQKYLKNTVLKKWKLEQRRKKIKDWKSYFKYHIYHSYSMNFMILKICFVTCNVLGHFLPF